MKSKVLNCGTLSILLLMSSVLVLGKSTLKVTVVDQNGTPQHKAEVSAMDVTTSKVKKKKSGKDGVAKLEKLEEGFYRVWVRQDGFSPALREFIHLAADAQDSIEIALKPGNKEQKLYFEDTQVDQRASQLLREGSQALQARNVDVAEAKLKESLEINPSQPVSYQNLGILYYQQGNWDLAEKYLQQAVEHFAVYAKMQPTNQAVATQLEQVQNMVDLLPVEKLGAEATAALKENKFDEAVAKLHQVIELQPDNPNAYYNLTLALARGKRMDEAYAAIDKAIELAPQNQSFKDTRRDLEEAEKTAIAKEARDAVAGVDELLQAGQYEEALAKAEEVRQSTLDNYMPTLWLASARANVQLERPDEASAAFKEAIALVPEKVEYRRELAEYLFKLERYEESFGVYKELWQLSSEPLDESFFKLGQDLVKRGKQDMAMKAFEQVLETNPDYAEAYYELGIEYFYGKDDREKAKEMLGKYVETGQDEAHLSNAKNVLVVIEKGR